LPITGSSGRPSSLQVHTVFAGAETVDKFELASGEGAGCFRGGSTVEERVNVAAYDVDNSAKGLGVILPDVEGFGGSAWAAVTFGCEGGFAGCDKRCEFAGGAESGEDSFITDDDELDERPLAPGDDVGDLLLCAGNSVVVDEYTQDHLHAVS